MATINGGGDEHFEFPFASQFKNTCEQKRLDKFLKFIKSHMESVGFNNDNTYVRIMDNEFIGFSKDIIEKGYNILKLKGYKIIEIENVGAMFGGWKISWE